VAPDASHAGCADRRHPDFASVPGPPSSFIRGAACLHRFPLTLYENLSWCRCAHASRRSRRPQPGKINSLVDGGMPTAPPAATFTIRTRDPMTPRRRWFRSRGDRGRSCTRARGNHQRQPCRTAISIAGHWRSPMASAHRSARTRHSRPAAARSTACSPSLSPATLAGGFYPLRLNGHQYHRAVSTALTRRGDPRTGNAVYHGLPSDMQPPLTAFRSHWNATTASGAGTTAGSYQAGRSIRSTCASGQRATTRA